MKVMRRSPCWNAPEVSWKKNGQAFEVALAGDASGESLYHAHGGGCGL